MTDTRLESEDSQRGRRWYQLTLRSIIMGVAFAAFLFSTVVFMRDRSSVRPATMFDTVAVGDKALILDLEGGGFLLQVYPNWNRAGSMGTLVDVGGDYIAVRSKAGGETTEKIVRKNEVRFIQRVLPLKKSKGKPKIAFAVD